jgi:hypothetical protein
MGLEIIRESKPKGELMKVTVKENQQVENPEGGVFTEGDSFDVDDETAQRYIAQGLVEEASTKKRTTASNSDANASNKKRK